MRSTLGEDAARSLGIDLARTRLAVVAGTALSVGAATAVTGIIGFVGLLVPHVLRPFAGHRPGLLLPASMLGGAIFLLVADIGLRLLQPWVELRIGVLTALIGAPFFVWLVLKTRGGAGAMKIEARGLHARLGGREVLRGLEFVGPAGPAHGR